MAKKEIIKVGYLVSYDYQYIFNSLKLTYALADKIVLCYDKDFKTWSGNTFEIPNSFFEKIKNLDTENKIFFYSDVFYVAGKTPMELDTRQRQMLGNFMGKGGWHLQIDSDEYAYDFEKMVTFLKANTFLLRNPKKTPIDFLAKWIVLFKQDQNGFYIIKPFKETCFLITNYPEYIYSRKTNAPFIILDYYVIHQSWARDENEIFTKLNNWSHKDDFDVNLFFENWKNLSKENHKDFTNFHPLTQSTWENLEYVEAENVEDFINQCTIKYPQKKLKLKWKLRLKLFIKSFF